MSEAIADILNRFSGQPPEVAAVKNYVHKKFGSKVSVRLNDGQVIILASSAALAGRLRLDLPVLQKAVGLKKRPTLRIG